MFTKQHKISIISAIATAVFVLAAGCEWLFDEPYENEWGENPDYIAEALSESYDPDGTWAFYWYLCGSDLESEGGAATTDFEEILSVRLPDNIKVIIETGGAYSWEADYVDASKNCRFLYDSDGLTLIEAAPRADMGDGKTLESFLRFCNNYPADNRVVILWDHGGGSVAGVCWDETTDNILTLDEIRAAFTAASGSSPENPPYEIVGFDACLMATIDVADTLYGVARYMVASAETEPSLGWNYKGFLEALIKQPDMNGARLGKAMCDTYYEACDEEWVAGDTTLSVVDIGRLDVLQTAYYNVGAEAFIKACQDVNYIPEFGRAAGKAINYGGNTFFDGYTNMIDLGDLVRRAGEALLPEHGEALINALNECVIYKKNGIFRENSSGLACYYSFNGDIDDFNSFAELSDDNPFEWYINYSLTGTICTDGESFLSGQTQQENLTVSVPDNMPALSLIESAAQQAMAVTGNLDDFPLTLGDDGFAYLNVGAEIAEQLIGVYCVLAVYDEESDIAIIFGRDNDIDADWDSGVFADNFRGVWGAIDGAIVYMELTDEEDDFQLYAVPVLLNSEEYTMIVSYVYDTEKYEILGARKGIDEDTGLADKDLRRLVPGDVVEPVHYVFFGDDEDYTEMTLESITVTSNTSFEDIDIGDGVYLYWFEMVDFQHNSYYSDTAVFEVENGEIYLWTEE